MQIAEVYASLQGEGRLAGTPSVFVRTSGCNLRCHWCDTPFTSWQPSGEQRDVTSLIAEVTALGLSHVVVTGGEPLLAAGIGDLCYRLRAAGQHVTIETAATVLPPDGPPTADLMSLSPKLRSSTPAAEHGEWRQRHADRRRRDDVIRTLMQSAPQYQLKFVIDSPADLDETTAWLADLGVTPGTADCRHVQLMPQGTSPEHLAATAAWLQTACIRLGFRFCHRHHIEWFGNVRGS